MACEDQINTQDLINAKTDATTLGEVATSRAGAIEGGAPITTSTNRFGEVTDTIQGRLNKLGIIYDDPIRDWSASLLVSDLRAHRYPATTGDIYTPKKALPFTTGGSFNTNDWVILQGITASSAEALVEDLEDSFVVTVSEAKTTAYTEGTNVIISDRDNMRFKYQSGRELIAGQVVTLLTADDEVHILTNDGGMLVFDDWQKLSQLEAVNYTRYLAKLNIAGESIAITNYGDSLTWGQAVSGQTPTPWPVQLKNVLNSTTENTWTNTNRAISGDRIYQQYIRYPSGATSDITTIMLSTNDTLFATLNGANPGDVLTDPLYSIQNYTEIMRKMVAREILRGNVCVVFGSIQISNVSNGSLGIYESSLLSSPYDAAGESVAKGFGCMYVDTKRDVFSGHGTSESAYDGIHLKDEYYQVLGSKISAVFLQKDFKNKLSCIAGSVMTGNPIWNPISSDTPIIISTDAIGTSPPLAVATGVKLDGDTISNTTFAFYCPEDNMVVYPTINNSANAQWRLNVILDQGAIQPDYPCDTPLGFPLAADRNFIFSQKNILKIGSVNRSTELYSKLDFDCYIHITTRGWHYITFNRATTGSDVAIESLVFDSIVNVVNNDINGGLTSYYEDDGGVIKETGFPFSSVTSPGTGKKTFNFSRDLNADAYHVEVEIRDDEDFAMSTVKFKIGGTFTVVFSKDVSGTQTLFDPDHFVVRVIGGK